jgi:hypothetical protein
MADIWFGSTGRPYTQNRLGNSLLEDSDNSRCLPYIAMADIWFGSTGRPDTQNRLGNSFYSDSDNSR